MLNPDGHHRSPERMMPANEPRRVKCLFKWKYHLTCWKSGMWLKASTLTVTVVHTSCGSNSHCKRCLSDSDLVTFHRMTFQDLLFSFLYCCALNGFLLCTFSPLASPLLLSFHLFCSPLRQQSEWQPSLQMQTTKIASVVLIGLETDCEWLMQKKIFDKLRIFHCFEACCLSWGTSVSISHINNVFNHQLEIF